MNYKAFSKSVVKIKQLNLLGEVSHAKLSPPYRLDLAKKMKEKAKTAQQAGVLALFYPNAEGITNLVLILRKTYKGVHSAQVGFPGGKLEDQDTDLMATAIRETEEEIGISAHQFDVLKTLSPLYIPPSNFLVHPYLAISEHELNFIKQDDEVEAIIEVNLSDVLDDHNIIDASVPTSYGVDVDVPAFKLNGHIVWGATAMMLSEIKDMLKQVL